VYRRPDLIGPLAGGRGAVRQQEAVRVSPSAQAAAGEKGPRADRSPPRTPWWSSGGKPSRPWSLR